MKILLAIHYNLNNGDRAVLEATKTLLKGKYGKNLELIVSVFDTAKVTETDFRCVPWGFYTTDSRQRRLIKLAVKTGCFSLLKIVAKKIINPEFLKAVKETDIIYISGGHHLTDILGDDVYYSLALNILVAEFYNKKVILLPQTIGHFKNENKLKDRVLRYIIKNANATAYRDEASKKFLQEKECLFESCIQVPDVVYSIPKQSSSKKFNKKSIGVALYGNYSGPDAKDKIFWYSDELKKALKVLLQDGYKVQFIPMEIKETKADDRWIAQRIIDSLPSEYNNAIEIVEPKSGSILDTIKLFGQQDYIFAYKTHSVVFATIQRIPLVAVAYHEKTIDFMKKANLGEYTILDLNADSEQLLTKFKKIKEEYELIQKKEEGYISIANGEIRKFLDSIE